MTKTQLTSSVCSYGALRRATRGIGRLYDKALVSSGINASQYNVLSSIRRLGSPTQSELANDLVMDLSALGHTLKPLTREGWVALVRDAEDGRKRRIVMSEKGNAKLDEAHALWKPTQRKFDLALGKSIGKELRDLLDHLSSNSFADAFEDAEPKAVQHA